MKAVYSFLQEEFSKHLDVLLKLMYFLVLSFKTNLRVKHFAKEKHDVSGGSKIIPPYGKKKKKKCIETL